jgi:hypothetical protein
MEYDDIDWNKATNARELSHQGAVKRELKFDAEVTKILGKPVLVNDPRLIRLVVQFKKQTASDPESDKMDNFLYNPDFLVELRKTFA